MLDEADGETARFRPNVATFKQLAFWATAVTAVVGVTFAVIMWALGFARADKVEAIDQAQQATDKQVSGVIAGDAAHLELHKQSASEMKEMHSDIREQRDALRALLQQSIYLGRATHARTVELPELPPDPHFPR